MIFMKICLLLTNLVFGQGENIYAIKEFSPVVADFMTPETEMQKIKALTFFYTVSN